MSKKNILFFLFLSFFQIQFQIAQSIRLLSVEEGLSNNIVYNIHKDKQGYMWFATENGLNKYNGYFFEKFYHNSKDSSSISSSVCRDIIEDEDRNLWIATKNGISLYNSIEGNFKNYSILNKDLDIKELIFVNDDKIWFNTLGKAGYFNIKTKKFKFIDENYNSFCITSNKEKIWISSREGSLDVAFSNFIDLKNVHSNIGVRKQIFFGGFTNKLWLPKVDYNLEKEYSIIPILPNNIQPTKLLEIDENTLLIGTNEGLFEYDINLKKLQKKNLIDKKTSLNQQIRSIYKDDIGNIWIGTLAGVFHLDFYKKSFQHLEINKDSDDVIMGLTSSNNNLYMNKFGNGVYKYSLENNTFNEIEISTNKLKENLFIWDIKKVPQNSFSLWMASNDGLICYNPKSEKSILIRLPKGKDFYNTSFNLLDIHKNYMWVASHTGVHKVSKKENQISPTFSLVDIIIESSIQKILYVNNQIFIATEGKGLFVYNEKTKILKPVYHSINGERRIMHSTIWDMYLFGDKIWLGTNDGLFNLDILSMKINHTNIKNNIIFSIQKDDFGRLWMGTDKGLMSYSLDTKYSDIFTNEERVLNTEFNRRSVTKTNDGQLWFGGVKGITHFYPSKIRDNKIIPPVYITKLEIIASDSTFTYNHRREKSVVLPYNQNTISLEYVALNYTNSTQNNYKYQLIGRDENWVEDKGNRFSRYVQLPPGNYTFKVIAANNDGVWNTKGDELQIEILPPFWQTLWFQALIILLIIAIFYSIHYYKIKRIIAIERMKLRIASDLHDEVGSGLSGIALTSDILEQQFKKGEVKPQLLNRITKNARNLAATLDDIVWLINPEKEALEDFILKSKTLAKELLQTKNINFQEQVSAIDKKQMLTSEQKRNLFLFVKEAISNIIKHANANNVKLSFKLINKQFYLNISDDGIGFDTNQKTIRNGLITMKNRAKILKGELQIYSKIGQGTELKLHIKIP